MLFLSEHTTVKSLLDTLQNPSINPVLGDPIHNRIDPSPGALRIPPRRTHDRYGRPPADNFLEYLFGNLRFIARQDKMAKIVVRVGKRQAVDIMQRQRLRTFADAYMTGVRAPRAWNRVRR